MKKYFILIAIALGLLSCSLEEKRTSFANRGSCYETVFQMRSVVNSCYIPIKQMMNYSFGMGMEAATDLWYDNTSVADAICDITPTKSGQAKNIWTYCYKGVMYCNEAITCMENSTSVPNKDKEPLIAECHVLRALYYYYLTCVFNGVPYYTYMVEDMETLAKIRQLPRTDADEIRNNLYKDLKDNALPYFTEANGYWRRTSEIDGNRAGAPLALMLMAKMMMWNEDWDAALEALGQLEKLYGTLNEERYPLKDTWWSVKNTAESIFEVQHAWSPDGIQSGGAYCRLLYPSIDNGTLDGIYMPYFGTQLTSHSVLRCTDYFAHWRPASNTFIKKDDGKTSLFDPLPLTWGEYNLEWQRYSAVLDFDAIKSGTIRGRKIDKRVLHVIGMGDLWNYGQYDTAEPTPDDKTFNSIRKNGRGYGGPKFWFPGMVSNNDGNNYKIFRYADAVLMMAECWCMKNELDKAVSYLSQTRQRAGVDPFTTNDQGAMMSFIRDERARELAGEMHRRFDLVRWGIWYDAILANNKGNIIKYIKPCHRFYPIPDKECSLSGGILTNPEYEGIADGGREETGEEQFEDE